MRLIKEPFVHFLLCGALLFCVYAWMNRDAGGESGDDPRVIRLTRGEVAWIVETWSRQWQRPPTETELRGLVSDYLREHVLAREAQQLGLEQGDTIVRRRLAQKMEFLMQGLGVAKEATDEELEHYYELNPQRFETPARVSFVQVFFQPQSADAAARAADALRVLASDPSMDVATIGDRSLLQQHVADEEQRTVSSLFGEAFAERVLELEPGRWHGPIESAYGLHLVWVTEMQPARLLPFTAARERVLEDWRRDQQQKQSEELFAALLEKYRVEIDENVQPLLGAVVVRSGD